MRLALLLFFSARAAFAYNEAIHAFITRTAYAGAEDLVQPPTQQDLEAFRTLFWTRASANAEFLKRYPTAASFDAWQFKEFLMLDPAAHVHGFDLTPDEQHGAMKRVDLLALASRWPDDDERNRHRYFRDPQTHEIVKASDGTPTPYDPATLDFGSLTGTTSQGHAHYGLIDGPLSDDPEVLKKDPRRFAVPPTAHAYGAEFEELYTELARLAASSSIPAKEWLICTFAGAAFHHIEDCANQIHTVQVGIYEFFESAFFQSKLRDVKTLGGLLGERRSLKQIGLRLIANHHLLSEDYFAKRVAEKPPAVQPDPAFQPRADLMGYLIDLSSQEAPQVYRLTWQFSAPTLHDGMGHEFDGTKDNPDDYVRHDQPQAIAEFMDLEMRGLRRSVAALHIWQQRFNEAPANLPIDSLIKYHVAAAGRRATYRPASPENAGIAWGYPVAAALVLAGAAALIWSRLSKRS